MKTALADNPVRALHEQVQRYLVDIADAEDRMVRERVAEARRSCAPWIVLVLGPPQITTERAADGGTLVRTDRVVYAVDGRNEADVTRSVDALLVGGSFKGGSALLVRRAGVDVP